MLNNTLLINKYIESLNNGEIKKVLFKDKFNFHMAKTSLGTLLNIEILIDEYLKDTKVKNNNGDKIILLFGILQGLFVGIDSIYTIGKATGLNKLMINLNQHESLREIKNIRNDVVGHPTYRYYENNSVGYCTLDLDHIEDSKITYFIHTYENNKIVIKKRQVDLINSINDYHTELDEILTRTIKFNEVLLSKEKTNLSRLISSLGEKFIRGIYDENLLEDIRVKYSKLFNLPKSANNRVIWRLNLIDYLFNFHDKNEYTRYLTYSEIHKLYLLVFNFENKVNNKLKYKFIKYKNNQEFKYLRSQLLRLKDINFKLDILHDSRHPLYNSSIKLLISRFKLDTRCSDLINWIESQVNQSNDSMLYLIGSELKKWLINYKYLVK